MKKLILLSLTLLSTAFATGDAAKGKALFMACQACHGVNAEGNKMIKGPALFQQEDWYMAKQLKKFKEGIRGAHPKDMEGMQMAPMAKMLKDDAAINDVVAYIKTLKGKIPTATVKGDAVKGKTGYAMCQACHGAQAEGNKMMNAPKLAGSSDWYLVTQLKKFKNGVRGAHAKDIEGMQMAPMAKFLKDDAAINDVVAYINELSK